MLEKKEKMVMLFLSEVCSGKKSYLISADQIAEYLSRKYVLSIAELDEIMLMLSKDNYIDLVFSDGKKGYFYCISLKNKGLTFKKDLIKHRKELVMLVLRTLGITILSFIVGLILRAIFN
ncbi:MAG: hypothetical protein PHX09_01465 [Clostridia bacterium]|nr:hypothetical protein [Clostridia bacterium]MDD4685792.1 hypothetical protein [Clostridia bacterium]